MSTSSTTQIDGLIQSVREVAGERLRDVGRRLGCAVKLDALAPVPSVVEEIVDEAVDEADADS